MNDRRRRLINGHNKYFRHVDMRFSTGSKDDIFGNVRGDEGLDAFVDVFRSRFITSETGEGECWVEERGGGG